MKSRRVAVKFTLLFVVLSLMLTKNAYAYLDPGSGSFLLQILMAGLLAASLTLKRFWSVFISFIRNPFRKKEKGKNAESEASSS